MRSPANRYMAICDAVDEIEFSANALRGIEELLVNQMPNSSGTTENLYYLVSMVSDDLKMRLDNAQQTLKLHLKT